MENTEEVFVLEGVSTILSTILNGNNHREFYTFERYHFNEGSVIKYRVTVIRENETIPFWFPRYGEAFDFYASLYESIPEPHYTTNGQE